MKIYLPSRELRQMNAMLRCDAAKTALRQWHPKRVLFARLTHEDVRILETLERRLAPSGRFEYRARKINAINPGSGDGVTGD